MVAYKPLDSSVIGGGPQNGNVYKVIFRLPIILVLHQVWHINSNYAIKLGNWQLRAI